MIYQMHPDHGRHMAGTPMEAKSNRDNGWKDVTKKEFYAEGNVDTTEKVEKTRKGKKG